MTLAGGIRSRDLRHFVDLQTLPDEGLLALWLIPFATFSALTWVCVKSALTRSVQPFRALISRDRPLWCVYVAVPAVVLACSPFGGEFHALVLLHVVGWWIFASISLARTGYKAAPVQSVWTWVRTTQTGFQTLHGVSALVTLALLLFYVHSQPSFQQTAWSWVLDRDAFYYWTVMHVTVSFVPKA